MAERILLPIGDWERAYLGDSAFAEPLGRVHEWRSYVPSEIVVAWPSLDAQAREIVYYMARLQANAEDWD